MSGTPQSGNRACSRSRRRKRQERGGGPFRPAAPLPFTAAAGYWMTVIRSVAGGASGAAAVECAAR